MTPKDTQKSVVDYRLLHRIIFVHRYDRALMILLLIVFVGSIGLLITAPQEPETGGDYQQWTIAVAGFFAAAMLLSFVVNLITARILIQELERLRGENRAVGRDAPDSDGTHSDL